MTGEDEPCPLRHVWKPVYERFELRNIKRVVATVVDSGVDLILKLTEESPEPFDIFCMCWLFRAGLSLAVIS